MKVFWRVEGFVSCYGSLFYLITLQFRHKINQKLLLTFSQKKLRFFKMSIIIAHFVIIENFGITGRSAQSTCFGPEAKKANTFFTCRRNTACK